MDLLGVIANVAGIATALGAGWAYGQYRYRIRKKRILLEQYLKAVKERPTKSIPDTDRPHMGVSKRRTSLRIMAEIGMTEAEVLQACFDSKVIKRSVMHDKETGVASCLFFEYDPAGHPAADP